VARCDNGTSSEGSSEEGTKAGLPRMPFRGNLLFVLA
jgi:hypothetical protein